MSAGWRETSPEEIPSGDLLEKVDLAPQKHPFAALLPPTCMDKSAEGLTQACQLMCRAAHRPEARDALQEAQGCGMASAELQGLTLA